MPWATTTIQIPQGNRGNERTLAAMRRLAQRASVHPRLIQAAHDIVRHVPERNDEATFAAVLEDVRGRMRYTHDPLGAELVKDPVHVVGMSDTTFGRREPMDCDDASTLTAAFLGALGYQTKFVTVAVDPNRPDEWSHVYVKARRNDGRWRAMDPIVREFAVGQEVPENRLTAPRADHEGVTPMRLGCEYTRMAGLGEDAPWWQQVLEKTTGAIREKSASDIARSQVKLQEIQARRDIALAKSKGGSGFSFTNADGSPNWVVIGGAAAVGIAAFMFLKKRR